MPHFTLSCWETHKEPISHLLFSFPLCETPITTSLFQEKKIMPHLKTVSPRSSLFQPWELTYAWLTQDNKAKQPSGWHQKLRTRGSVTVNRYFYNSKINFTFSIWTPRQTSSVFSLWLCPYRFVKSKRAPLYRRLVHNLCCICVFVCISSLLHH